MWEWQKDRSDESGKAQKIQHVDGKYAYHLDDVSDSLVGTINPAGGDNYPNIRNRLGKAGVSLTGSTEAVICRLKTAYRSLILFAREVNFNWIQLQIFVEFDVLKVGDMFMSNENKRMMENLPPTFSTQSKQPLKVFEKIAIPLSNGFILSFAIRFFHKTTE